MNALPDPMRSKLPVTFTCELRSVEHKEGKRSKTACRFAYGQLMITSKSAGTSDPFDENTVPRLSLKAQEAIVLRDDVERETSPTDKHRGDG